MRSIYGVPFGARLLAMTLWFAPLAMADSTALIAEARKLAEQEKHDEAVRRLDRALQDQACPSSAYYWRGRSRFCLGQMEKAVADFDRFVKEEPQLASRQWERGIALYYAGRYERGAKQFELYQTYHDNDVENSVWRFLCLSRTDGVEKARATMLPIRQDPRIPMMTIYEMFRGKQAPDDVFAAARGGDPEPDVLKGRMFYARLYVGLYHEALSQNELARRFLLQAADEHRATRTVNRYMWSVADVHARRLRGE